MRKWLSAFFILALTLTASADTSLEYEAASLYDGAYSDYQKGLTQSALRKAHLSREYYIQLGNDLGAEKCMNLINQIEANLSPTELGGIYYMIAGQYYVLAGNDLVLVERAIDMGLRCERACKDDMSCGLKCLDITQQAKARKKDILMACTRQADQLYDDAEMAVIDEEYLLAKSLALNASEKYIRCEDDQGAVKTGVLLGEIARKVKEYRMQALGGYDEAMEYFTLGDNQLCIEYALKSLDIYGKTGDIDGVSKVTALLNKCGWGEDEWEQQMKDNAREYHLRARYQLKVLAFPDCENATENLNRSISIYHQLYDWAFEKEKRLINSLRYKTNYYADLLDEVQSLVTEKNTLCARYGQYRRAEYMYQDALKLYSSFNYSQALSYAQKSQAIFDSLGKYADKRKCDSLETRIQYDIEQGEKAISHVKDAESNRQDNQYLQALTDISDAKSIYLELDDQKTLSELNDLIRAIEKEKNIYEEGNSYLGDAQECLERKEYKAAIGNARSAKTKYNEVGFEEGITKSEEIISRSQDMLEASQGELLKKPSVTAAIMLVILALFYLYQRGNALWGGGSSKRRGVKSRRTTDEETRSFLLGPRRTRKRW